MYLLLCLALLLCCLTRWLLLGYRYQRAKKRGEAISPIIYKTYHLPRQVGQEQVGQELVAAPVAAPAPVAHTNTQHPVPEGPAPAESRPLTAVLNFDA
ncbi:hypothetical protein Q0590_26375 [Rhodocytophaga aerolata]|uniref:DUF4834 family protein n=2 Tax=Rhodocytophaga aerolata TaxID=455078 RepID=A0ABT8RF92_9BACT|nr:hypothetical protein [Rhodocytophaga aerolata]MDO1449833.1 hypothetical protein [Rhodocytophaga aerolata]